MLSNPRGMAVAQPVVNAIDARAVLRYSAKLDSEELDPYRADADGSGSINAVDARIILRKATEN